MEDFVSEDDLNTFEGWLRYQNFSVSSPDELESLREIYADVHSLGAALPEFGQMKLKPMAVGEYRYAVASQDGANLWLNLWVKRSAKGEFFVMVPRNWKDFDLHASYHLDGMVHIKSEGQKQSAPDKRQPLNTNFRGCEHLFTFSGYSPKRIGAVCDSADFSNVIEIQLGVVGPRDGQISVHLLEPNAEPPNVSWLKIARTETYRDSSPWVVITVGSVNLKAAKPFAVRAILERAGQATVNFFKRKFF